MGGSPRRGEGRLRRLGVVVGAGIAPEGRLDHLHIAGAEARGSFLLKDKEIMAIIL